MLCTQIRSGFAPCLVGRSSESVGLVGRSGGSTMLVSGRAYSRWSSGIQSVLGMRHRQLPAFSGSLSFRGLEAGLLYVRILFTIVADRALGSIYASQAGRKVMGREARDLAVASSTSSKL